MHVTRLSSQHPRGSRTITVGRLAAFDRLALVHRLLAVGQAAPHHHVLPSSVVRGGLGAGASTGDGGYAGALERVVASHLPLYEFGATVEMTRVALDPIVDFVRIVPTVVAVAVVVFVVVFLGFHYGAYPNN